MAKLPPIKRFTQDDFPNQKSWIGSLLYPLNLFLNATYAALNNGLTINQNMIGLTKVSIVNLSGTTTLTGTTSIVWPYLQTPPVGVLAINCIQLGNNGGSVILPSITGWTYDSGVVTIPLSTPNPTGSSQTNLTYNITFWICGG